MYYINVKDSDGDVETIDEFETYKEAVAMAIEYRLVYQGSGMTPYMSQRSTKDWRER